MRCICNTILICNIWEIYWENVIFEKPDLQNQLGAFCSTKNFHHLKIFTIKILENEFPDI